MKYILLSVLVLVAVMVVPSAFAATHTDTEHGFSIDYPSGWIKEITDTEYGDLWITDKYDWHGGIGVFHNLEGNFIGMNDSDILDSLKVSERDYCNSQTYQVDGYICYNYNLVSSNIFSTEQNLKAYLVNQYYTKQYDDPNFPGEYVMYSTVIWVLDGNNYAEIYTEMDDEYTDAYFDMLLGYGLSYKNLSYAQDTTPYAQDTTQYFSSNKYIDPNNRFSIEYPSGWILDGIVDDYDGLVNEFSDKYDWDAFFRIWFFEDVSYVGTSDSNVLREIIDAERGSCNEYSYQVDGIICYNYKVNDSSVVYTDENRKAYLIDQQYTKQYSDPDYSGEYFMRSIVLETHVGNDVWYMDSEVKSGYLDMHLHKVIKSINSFKLLQSQPPTTTPTPTPTPTPAPVGSITGVLGITEI